MLHHIVLFSFEGFGCEEEKTVHLAKIKEALEALPEQISALESMHVFINQNPAESYDLMLEAVVRDMATLPIYANAPSHQRIVQELIKPYLRSRACVDYFRN